MIAASFERIHRSNLVGMGVLPLEFCDGQTWQSLGLTGEETFDFLGLDARDPAAGRVDRPCPEPGKEPHAIPREGADRYAYRVGVLPQRRHFADRGPQVAPLTPLGEQPSQRPMPL